MKLFSLLLIIITTCLGFVLATSRIKEEDSLAAWFKDENGQTCTTPCLFGITPGKTKFQDALRIISVHPVTRDMQLGSVNDPVNDAGFGNGKFCVLLWRTKGEYVRGITVSTRECYFSPIDTPEYITLNQIINSLGSPTFVTLGAYGVAPDYYFFLNGQMVFQSWNDNRYCRLVPTATYETLELTDHDLHGSDAMKWKGFMARSQYVVQSEDEQANCIP